MANDKPPSKGGTDRSYPNSTARWSPAGRGRFTGIDYDEPGAADGLDPYLVWVDINGFAHLAAQGRTDFKAGPVPEWLPVLIHLAENVAPAELVRGRGKSLRVPTAYTEYTRKDQPALRTIPATVSGDFLALSRRDAQLRRQIARIDVDLPRNLQAAQQIPGLSQPLLAGMPCKHSGQRKVIAFIDDGCAFAHPHFLTGDPQVPVSLHTRIQRFWDQNPRPGKPNGVDFAGADLDALIQAHALNGFVDEAAVYAAFSGSASDSVNRLRRRAAHGTQVLDLACGPYFLEDTMCARVNAPAANPTWLKTADDASRAPILFVQLPMRTVQDSSGRGTMPSDVINALTYIVNQCEPDVQIVVNLSWGTLAGPHDGSSLLESAIDQMVASMNGRLQVVIPAGNGYQSRTHASFCLGSGQMQMLQWRVQPDDTTESYVEFWMEPGTVIELRITLPNGLALPPVIQGQVFRYAEPFNDPTSLFGVSYAHPAPGARPGILLAIAPTVSEAGTRPVAPHGLWKLEVVVVQLPAGASQAAIDAYIERDDVALGTRHGARQSRFEDPLYDREDTEDATSGLHAAAVVRREGGFNGIATGALVTVAGGVRESDLSVAEYSPRNVVPPPVCARPGTRRQVDQFATTEESLTLHGVRAAGSLGGSTVRLSGTSDAAPQIARDLFNAL
jgi:hypothetical protein